MSLAFKFQHIYNEGKQEQKRTNFLNINCTFVFSNLVYNIFNIITLLLSIRFVSFFIEIIKK